MDLPEVHGRIAEIRRDEMAKAAEILGVEHTWLGFVDSGLPRATAATAAGGLLRADAAGGVRPRRWSGWCASSGRT